MRSSARFECFYLSLLCLGCMNELAAKESSLLRTELPTANAGALHLYTALAPNAKLEKVPTILALHGCSGMLNAQGRPTVRVQNYAALLNTQGWNVVFTDSFTGRGVKSVCGGKADVTQAQRLQDTQQAIAHLAAHPKVDASRMAILGWSHGGTATLQASAKGVEYAAKPVAALAFYPGCGPASVPRGWAPAFPVLMQLGASDDWTDPLPCQKLAVKWSGNVRQTTYANAYHGFDSDAKLMQLKSVISRSTGQGVHLGGEPAAKTASQTALMAFFSKAFE